MKAVVVVLLLVAVVLADEQFDRFLAKYGKHYEGAEYVQRMKIYRSNLRRAAALNAQGNSVHGETQFSDLTQEEFKSMYLMPDVDATYLAKSCLISPDYLPKPRDARADTVDWSTNPNVVTSVKNQGSCGSCWAFSTIEAVEGQVGQMAGFAGWGTDSLSPMYIVDCSKGSTSEIYMKRNTTVTNDACNGGWPWTAFDDLSSTASPTHIGGIPMDSTYPYNPAYLGTCKATTGSTYSITGYNCVTQSTDKTGVNEDTLAQVLTEVGPLSIALNANYFSSYTGGIFNNPLCTGGVLNHAVLLVGYGTEGTTQYWKIKNSWGASWGEAGYIRMVKGKGMCGMNEAVSYPTGPYKSA